MSTNPLDEKIASSSPVELPFEDFASRSLIDYLDEALLLADIDGKVTAANEVALRQLGYTRDEVLGRLLSDFVAHAEFVAGRGLSHLLRPPIRHSWEASLITGTGAEIPMSIHLVGLPEGDDARSVVVIAKDLRPQRRMEELGVLHAVAVASIESTHQDILIERVTDLIGEALYPDNFGVLLMDEAAGVLRVHPSYRGATEAAHELVFAPGKGIVGSVAASGSTWRVPDVRNEAIYLDVNPGTLLSELCVPIKFGDRVLGVINAESSKLNFFSDADERLLDTAAGLLATALERLWLFQSERQQRRLAEALREVGSSLGAVLDVDVVLDQLLDQIAQVVSYDAACVMLVSDGVARVTRQRGYGGSEDKLVEEMAGLTINVEEAANLQWMTEKQESLFVSDTWAEPTWIEVEATSRFRSWVGAPIVVQGRVLGFFSLDKVEVDFYHQSHAERLISFAGQAGLALQNAHLFEESMRQTQELSGLYQTALATGSVLETDRLLLRLYEQVQRLLTPDTFSVVLFDENTAELEIAFAVEEDQQLPLAGTRIPLAEGGLTGWVVENRRPLLLNDVDNEALPVDPRHLTTPARSWLGIPLVAPDRIIGAVTVQSFRPNMFKDTDRRFLEAVSGQVAVGIENARLFEATRQQAVELRALLDVSSELRAAVNSEAMLWIILTKASGFVNAHYATIYLVDAERGDLVRMSSFPPVDEALKNRIPFGEGITGTVAQSGETHVSEDLGADPVLVIQPEERERMKDLVSAIAIPLRAQERTIGVLHLGHAEHHHYAEDEIRLLTAIAEIGGNALQRAGVLETLEQRVHERTFELEQANESLRELDRLKSDFVSNVSHELRTPITNILLYLDLMGQSGKESKRDDYMDILKGESARLARLIEDLLIISRIDQDRRSIDFAQHDLDSLMGEVITAHEARARSKHIQIQHERNPDLPHVLIDWEQIVQVFANLISNALAYTSIGGNVRLNSSAGESGGLSTVTIEVHNNGPMIPPGDLPHLFDRFYRGVTGRESGEPGTGLGLAICREIIERHGGLIEVQSDPDDTVFSVRLPAA